MGTDLVTECFEAGERTLATRPERRRKALGQFLTPPVIARYMARQLRPTHDGDHFLEPAIGSGVLACAVVERAIQERGSDTPPITLWIDGYEIDNELAQKARECLADVRDTAATYGITVNFAIHETDFILAHTSPGPLFPLPNSHHYDHILANPPYFKLNKQDPRVLAMPAKANGYTNIYTLFIALALELLAPVADASFIVPRSFCSGLYFSAFRKHFIKHAEPIAVHLFESRNLIFEHADILQENIVFTFRRRLRPVRIVPPFEIAISSSGNAIDLQKDIPTQPVESSLFLGQFNKSLFFRLPISTFDKELIQAVDSWKGSLYQYGWDVSTGPVVAFRARDYLTGENAVNEGRAVPLLWLHNVQSQVIEWPNSRRNKPQGILRDAAEKLLVPLSNYVLLRRFSAKEERRRLVTAPLIANEFSRFGASLGLENHLNFIYRQEGQLTVEEAIGLSTLLNSAVIDRYFRILNGSTQVNATELRALPLPPLTVIQQLGQAVTLDKCTPDLEALTFDVLREAGCLPADFPTIRETRTTMGKIQ